MHYEEAVKAAANALATGEEANWELARLTYENTRGGNGKDRSDPDKVTLEQWATDVQATGARVRFSNETAGRYRRMWETFCLPTSANKPRPPWTEAWYEAIDPKEENAERRRISGLKGATPETKLKAAKILLSDPVVMSAPEVQAQIVETVAKDTGLTLQTAVRVEELRPTPKPRERRPNAWDLIAALPVGAAAKTRVEGYAHDVNVLVQWCRDHRPLDATTLEAIQFDAAQLREAAETLRRYAATIELATGAEVLSR